MVNVRILGVVNVRLANNLTPHFAVVLFDGLQLSLFLPFVTFVLKELTLIIKRIQPDLSISINIFKALESVVFKLPLEGLQGKKASK